MLIGGVVSGLGLASLRALTGGAHIEPPLPLPPGAVARINGTVILRADLALQKNQETGQTQTAMLESLINDELLVQYALKMNLTAESPKLRQELIAAASGDIISRAHAKPISPVSLRDYYFKNKTRYTRPVRVRVRIVFFPTPEAGLKKNAFEQALQNGATAQTLIKRFAGEAPVIQAGLISLQTLKSLIGEAPVHSLQGLPSGQWSNWVDTDEGTWRLYLANRTRARTPELESVRDQVEKDYLEERGKLALRAYLNRLRRKSDIALRLVSPQ